MEVLYKETFLLVEKFHLLKQYGLYGAVAGSLILYTASLAIYRLYFHPLAGFPGPRIAAVSRWYEFYHDVVKRGNYVYKIEEMHQKYGKVQFLLRGHILLYFPLAFPRTTVTSPKLSRNALCQLSRSAHCLITQASL